MSTIAIDWSGAKVPLGKLWLAELSNGRLVRVEPLRSRSDAEAEVVQAFNNDPFSIVGLDFAFSMPSWFIKDQGISSVFEFWRCVENEGEQWLRECKSPFWGRPGKRRPNLSAHFRKTEERIGRVAGISPKSVFQVGGAGAVGTGSIRGMPVLGRLREAGVAVWPFDSASNGVLVEIYPRVLTGPVNKSSAEGRRVYLQERWKEIPEQFFEKGVKCEDAFDALVSALEMDRHTEHLKKITATTDPQELLEGIIWVPPVNQLEQPGRIK